ncbi:MAG: exopolysaccharide biosynthesis polyprenyl glycosylphosphotransferase [Bacteroidetes bacterium]|jgi:exopolysaccharide biosynthesis polyprenyl glycosylphosphotransferase|nr:exopolysaccharide biosynthesis polyprenyl glycosylphosphotransferase [Bacteroidota bacterium]
MKPLNIIQAYNRKKQFKGPKRFINYAFDVLDILASLLAFYLSFLYVKNMTDASYTFDIQHIIFGVLLIPVLYVLLQTTNLARVPRTSKYISIFFDLIRYSVPLSLVALFYIFVFRLTSVKVLTVVTFIPMNIVLLYLVRVITFSLFRMLRSSGHNSNNVLIIADDSSEYIIEKILKRKDWGFRVLMIATNSQKIKERFGNEIKIIPDKIGVKPLITNDIFDEVIYAKSEIEHDKINRYIKDCEEIGVVFRMQSELSPLTASNAHLINFEEVPMLTFMNTPTNSIAIFWKTLTESIFSFFALLFMSPFLLLIVIAIKLDSKGPVVFKQKRVGLRGRQFYIYKFRTMVINAEEIKQQLMDQNESDGPTFKIKQDPRITRVGRILRKTSLDELPQLFNVVKGEMSLIGPRPPLPSEVEQYERWQLRRLSMRPGITCTWQIVPNRNDVVFEKWMKMDINYIENWSLKRDVKLFFDTIKSVISAGGY